MSTQKAQGPLAKGYLESFISATPVVRKNSVYQNKLLYYL